MSLSRRAMLGGSLATFALAGTGGCMTAPRARATSRVQIGFDRFSADFDRVVEASGSARLISTGHLWAEGPVWDATRARLYFTDVPRNLAWSWSANEGAAVWLDPSGISPQLAAGMREPGANGLLIGRTGELLICNHGTRAIEARDFVTGARRILANRFDEKRFNSPNDIIEGCDGTIYFTDPPYGLAGGNDSPLKELDANGVYRLDPAGRLMRIVDDMTFPNGIVLSPDESWLYVSQSDPDAPLIRRFALTDGTVREGERKPWFDARNFMHEAGGLPDGMAMAASGHVFLAGPSGVLVIAPDATCLGRINTGLPSANCAFGEDGRTLFITASDRVLAVRLKLSGLGAL